jgi:succinyl-CoA synthetase beta subunit
MFPGAEEFVVKAQIHAGGRGLGVFDTGFKGGVHVVKTPEEGIKSIVVTAVLALWGIRELCAVKDVASKMLGHRLKTKQTGPEGVLVNKVCCHSGRRS